MDRVISASAIALMDTKEPIVPRAFARFCALLTAITEVEFATVKMGGKDQSVIFL
jgi:hypothetical protein